MNEQNLKPQNQRSESERKEIASKGGKASGRKRREKREMREILEVLLSQPAAMSNGSVRKNPSTGEELNHKEASMVALILRADQGDIKATRLIAELMGELRKEPEIENNIIIDCHET